MQEIIIAIAPSIITGGLALIGVVITNRRTAREMQATLEQKQAVTDTKIEEHTSQVGWEPGATGTESLWEEICEQHDGSKYDPIPYDGNMALEADKYYSQNGVTYRCTRDTGNPVYNALSELVGIYVEIV